VLDGGCVAQREVIEKQREGQEQHQQAEAAERPVSPVQGERSSPAHGAGNDNNVQNGFSSTVARVAP